MKMRMGKYKDDTVTVIRAANAGDGDGFDPALAQLLVRDGAGAKKIVAAADVYLPVAQRPIVEPSE